MAVGEWAGWQGVPPVCSQASRGGPGHRASARGGMCGASGLWGVLRVWRGLGPGHLGAGRVALKPTQPCVALSARLGVRVRPWRAQTRRLLASPLGGPHHLCPGRQTLRPGRAETRRPGDLGCGSGLPGAGLRFVWMPGRGHRGAALSQARLPARVWQLCPLGTKWFLAAPAACTVQRAGRAEGWAASVPGLPCPPCAPLDSACRPPPRVGLPLGPCSHPAGRALSHLSHSHAHTE